MLIKFRSVIYLIRIDRILRVRERERERERERGTVFNIPVIRRNTTILHRMVDLHSNVFEEVFCLKCTLMGIAGFYITVFGYKQRTLPDDNNDTQK